MTERELIAKMDELVREHEGLKEELKAEEGHHDDTKANLRQALHDLREALLEKDVLVRERDQLRERHDTLVELSTAAMIVAGEPRELWDRIDAPSCPTIEAVKKLRNDRDELRRRYAGTLASD